MPKTWIIQGKYTTGPGSEWEELEEVTEEDSGGPNDSKKGRDYAYWLAAEYQLACPQGQHRVRVKN